MYAIEPAKAPNKINSRIDQNVNILLYVRISDTHNKDITNDIIEKMSSNSVATEYVIKGIIPNKIKLKKHVNPSCRDSFIFFSVLVLKYSLVPIENASAIRLENPMIMMESFDTFPATPPEMITNEVIKPSIDPRINGRITRFIECVHKLNGLVNVGILCVCISESVIVDILFCFVICLFSLYIPIEDVFIIK